MADVLRQAGLNPVVGPMVSSSSPYGTVAYLSPGSGTQVGTGFTTATVGAPSQGSYEIDLGTLLVESDFVVVLAVATAATLLRGLCEVRVQLPRDPDQLVTLARRTAEAGRRLRARLFRARLDSELAEEMRFHLEMRIRDLVARGMMPDEARRAAEAEFGNSDRVVDEVAQGFTSGAGDLIIQACRRTGDDRTAKLDVETTELTEPAPRMQMARVALNELPETPTGYER